MSRYVLKDDALAGKGGRPTRMATQAISECLLLGRERAINSPISS